MKSFADLFKNVLKNIPTETLIRDFVLENLKEKYNVEIDRKTIQLQKNAIILNVPPIIKSKIFSHKEKIIEDLNEYLQEKEVKLSIKNVI